MSEPLRVTFGEEWEQWQRTVIITTALVHGVYAEATACGFDLLFPDHATIYRVAIATGAALQAAAEIRDSS